MAPPSTKPILRQIDPQSLGERIATQVLEHIARLSVHLSPGVVVHIDSRDGASASGVALSVADLVAWAKDGVGALEEIPDLLLNVASILYARPIDQGTFQVSDLDEVEADPDTEIGVVLVAANARLLLARGQPIDARQLAAVSGGSAVNIRRLIREGEIGQQDGCVPASSARRWLSERKVPGFARRVR
jgi:hypothetical protein